MSYFEIHVAMFGSFGTSFFFLLLQAAMSLNSMLKQCLDEIPAAHRSTTPITLKATAGLRLLPAGRADNILNEVCYPHPPLYNPNNSEGHSRVEAAPCRQG